jgi:hypothetical protein
MESCLTYTQRVFKASIYKGKWSFPFFFPLFFQSFCLDLKERSDATKPYFTRRLSHSLDFIKHVMKVDLKNV